MSNINSKPDVLYNKIRKNMGQKDTVEVAVLLSIYKHQNKHNNGRPATKSDIQEEVMKANRDIGEETLGRVLNDLQEKGFINMIGEAKYHLTLQRVR